MEQMHPGEGCAKQIVRCPLQPADFSILPGSIHGAQHFIVRQLFQEIQLKILILFTLGFIFFQKVES